MTAHSSSSHASYTTHCNAVVLSAHPCTRLSSLTALCTPSLLANLPVDLVAECLEKRSLAKKAGHEWPGVGALVHALEDESPLIRIEAARGLAIIARSVPSLATSAFKLALEGLSDSESAVRLASAQSALQCQPPRLDAADLQVILQTASSDSSAAVREASMDVLEQGPLLSNSKHAAVAAWTMASRFGHDTASLAWNLGWRNAAALHGAARSLELAGGGDGVWMALAAAADRLGPPVGLSAEAMASVDEAWKRHQKSRVRQERAPAFSFRIANRTPWPLEGPFGVCRLALDVVGTNLPGLTLSCGSHGVFALTPRAVQSRSGLAEFDTLVLPLGWTRPDQVLDVPALHVVLPDGRRIECVQAEEMHAPS